MGVAVLLTGFVVRILGTDQWSLVVLATSAASLLSLLQVGAALGIAKRLTSLAAEERWDEFQRYYTASEVLGGILVLAALASVAALLGPGWALLRVPASVANEAKLVFTLAAASVALGFAQLPAIGAIQSAHRVDLIANATTRAFLARSIGMFGLLIASPHAWVYAAVAAAETALVLLQLRRCMRRVVPMAQMRRTTELWRDVRSIVVFNVALAFNSLNYILFLQLPVFALQRMGATQAVADYGILIQINNAARGLLVAGTNALGPLANAFAAKRDDGRLRETLLRATEIYVAAALLLGSWLFALRGDVLPLWLGAPSAALLSALPAFFAAIAFGIVAMPAAVVSTALEEVKLPAAAGLILSVFMALSYRYVRPEQALFDATLVLGVCFGAYQLVRIASVGVILEIGSSAMFRVLVRPVIAAMSAGLGFAFARRMSLTASATVLGGTACGVVLFVCASALMVSSEEKRWMAQHIGPWVRGALPRS